MSELLQQVADTVVSENEVKPNGLVHVNPKVAAQRILDDFVVIPRADLPLVERSRFDRDSYLAGGQSIVYTSVQNAREWVLRDLAVLEFMEQDEARVGTRRNALAAKFGGVIGNGAYVSADKSLKAAIDYIIELEETK